MIPLRIRAAAALLGLCGLALFAWTVAMTVPLVLNPDPMLGMELIVSALLLIAAGSVFGAGVGLARSAPWARPIAIGVAVVLILIAATLPLMTPSGIGGAGPPIHPVSWLLGGTGLALLVLAAKPYRQM